MKRQLYLFMLTLFLSTVGVRALAYDAVVDGIYYSFSGTTATVTSGDESYVGSVVIPETITYKGMTYSVTSIGDGAFGACTGLTSVTIGNSVTSISDYAFELCSSLTSLTLGNSVTSIGYAAFRSCSCLVSVDIPNSVKTIGDAAFDGCRGLTSVTIGNSVASIGSSSFGGCFSLMEVIIPNSVTSIGEMAFVDCRGLTSVTIGNSVTSIGECAFADCSDLTSVTVEMDTPVEISSSTFTNRANASLYVPVGCKSAYEASDYWKEFKVIVEMSPAAPDSRLFVEETSLRCGSQAELPVCFESEASFGGLQCEVTLPAGITLDKLTKTERLGDDFVLQKSKTGENTYQILLYNTSRQSFAGTDGALFTMTVSVDDNMAEGDYTLSFSDIVASGIDESQEDLPDFSVPLHVEKYLTGDANRDNRVNVTDIMAVANYILKIASSNFNEKAADVNGDSRVNVTDIMGIANIILKVNTTQNVPARIQMLDPQ